MSPPTRIITLNLGSQSIELAEFHFRSRDGLTLRNYCSRDLPVDPAQDGNRQPRIVAALHEMQRELQIKGGPVYYSVAEELIFTRFVELPLVDAEKVGRIVSFEAQQNVPFPIEEVVWDYQRVGSVTDKQIQVLLVAIKADLIEEINGAVESTGLHTTIVDLATAALYNAFRYNYGELSGCSLLIDIGARTTNLLFIEPGRIFTRSVPVGGSTITSSIAKEFNEPFVAAEFRKKRTGLRRCALAGFESADDEDARASRMVRDIMTRLHAELQRSINHYRGHQQGHAPDRVFLSGGVANTPGIEDFFREKLQLPIEFLNPLRKVALAESPRSEEIVRSAHLLGEPVGLALRAATDCPMRLDLSPKSVTRRKEFRNRRPFLIAAAACCFLSLLSWSAYYALATRVIRSRTEVIEEKVTALRRIESRLNEVRKLTIALDGMATPLIDAINDRDFWPQVIEDLNARLPKENIWITELTPTSGGRPLSSSNARTFPGASAPALGMSPARAGSSVRPSIDGLLLRGLYLFNPRQQEVVVDYFRALVDSPWFAVDPKNQARVIKPTTPNDSEWAFPYELRLDLRKPIALP